MNERIAELEHAISTLEAHRTVLGDAATETALAPLREQLAALRPGQDAQRLCQLSILFLDVAGSTALSQRLDPEDINSVLDGALARFSAIVARHGGRVLQYAGDSMLAVFGLGEAREQAPQFAVQAGLALLAEGRAISAEVAEQYGLSDFAVRVGVHSGEVLLGGGVDGENSLRGTSVNIAARMEQTAPLGGLRISRDTWRLVRGLFDMHEQAPISIKGCAEPMISYLVQAARDGSQARRGVEGLQTPLVGRAEELAQLQAAILALLGGQQNDMQRLLVIGDAGLGKSRLLAELRRWLAEQTPAGLLVQAEASESHRQQPYALLAQLLQQQFGLGADTRGPQAQAAWLATIAPQLDSEAAAAVLGQLLGYDFRQHPALGFGEDPRQLRAAAFHYASQLLRRATAPRLWLLDDAHWLDAGSQDFLNHLHDQHADLPMLIVALARPILFEQRADWAAPAERHRVLALSQLDNLASDILAGALLARLGSIPPDLRQLVCEGADGNPFFMEERVNMLIDQGALLCEPGGWHWLPERMQGKALPATLRGVLEARLATLPEAVHHVLQLASVVGMVFWDAALQELDAQASSALPDLLARELIVARPDSRLSGQREYAFRHHTLYQTCYEGTLKRVRKPAHAQLARWLSAQRGEEHLDLIAEHYEQGGEPQAALPYWQSAAESARQRYANSSAMRFIARAIQLAPKDDLQLGLALHYLQLRIAEFRTGSGDRETALKQLEELAASSQDRLWLSRAADQRANYLLDKGDAAAALQQGEAALALAPPEHSECMARAYQVILPALSRLGQQERLFELIGPALELARKSQNRMVEAAILNQIGMSFNEHGRFSEGIAKLSEALQLHQASGHKSNEAGTLANIAYAELCLGRFDAARQKFAHALSAFKAIGQLQNIGIIHINLAMICLMLNDRDAALMHADSALQFARESSDQWSEASALRVAGQAQIALGQVELGYQLLRESWQLFDTLQMPHLAMEAIASLAEAKFAAGYYEDAHALGVQIAERLERHLDLFGCDEPLRVLMTAYKVLAVRDPARAQPFFHKASEELHSRESKLAEPDARQVFLNSIPTHRDIVAERARRALQQA